MSVGFWMHEHADMLNVRCDRLYHLDPLPAHRWLEMSEPSDVTTGASQIVHEAGADWVRYHHENDGRRACEGAQLTKRCVALTQDDIGREGQESLRTCAQAGRITHGPADIDTCSDAFRPAQSFEPINNSLQTDCVGCCFYVAHQHRNPPHLFALLRARHQRPRSCTADSRDERAPVCSTDQHRIASP